MMALLLLDHHAPLQANALNFRDEISWSIFNSNSAVDDPWTPVAYGLDTTPAPAQ